MIQNTFLLFLFILSLVNSKLANLTCGLCNDSQLVANNPNYQCYFLKAENLQQQWYDWPASCSSMTTYMSYDLIPCSKDYIGTICSPGICVHEQNGVPTTICPVSPIKFVCGTCSGNHGCLQCTNSTVNTPQCNLDCNQSYTQTFGICFGNYVPIGYNCCVNETFQQNAGRCIDQTAYVKHSTSYYEILQWINGNYSNNTNQNNTNNNVIQNNATNQTKLKFQEWLIVIASFFCMILFIL